MTKEIITSSDYKDFITQIKKEVIISRNNALKFVNKELIELYFNIWKSIFEKQKKSLWWDDIIWKISKDLTLEFWKGFSKRNIFRMRKFYLLYKDYEKMPSLVAQISWTHNIRIMEMKEVLDWKDYLRREFYIKMSIKQKWSVRVLDHQIDFHTFEKWTLKQENFKDTLPSSTQTDISDLVKDVYDFSFLNLEEPFLEKKLEDLLVKSIEKTIKNFWTYISFVWRQVKVEVWEEDFYIDLLLYHRKLKSFVIIELKAWEFKAEYAWKMNFYLSALENQEMLEWENPPIWLILCKSKNRLIVEYSLKGFTKPMWVASYITQKDLPEELKWLLPTLEEIEREINFLSE